MRAAPVWAKTIEGGDADGGGEIAVAPTSRAGLCELEADVAREPLRELRQANGAGAPLHRRPGGAPARAVGGRAPGKWRRPPPPPAAGRRRPSRGGDLPPISVAGR